MEFQIYTELVKHERCGTLNKVVAYNKKYDLHYKGTIQRYKSDLFDPSTLRKYIDDQIATGKFTLKATYNHFQYLSFSIVYGHICDKPLTFSVELICQKDANEVIAMHNAIYDGYLAEAGKKNAILSAELTKLNAELTNYKDENNRLNAELTKCKEELMQLKKAIHGTAPFLRAFQN